MPYFVYVLLCEDGSYYTGSAKNVNFRFKQHAKGYGARYTKIHKPSRVVYVEKFTTHREALRREKAIKSLTRKKKQILVNS
ncbi:MAG: GIY-YIG nuclease family protein [Candidatus Bathyarchaeota archaeon]|nr:MAG: GIY-YIG nuclease family protein [Candidatus Bathyarchaeota archaeon]